jgi:hypothetical protein
MKKTWTLIALMAGAACGCAQGLIVWSDYVGSGSTQFSIDVWSPQPYSGLEQIGNSATDASPNSGTTVYTGQPLGGGTAGSGSTAYGNGNAWTIALYASTSASIPVVLTTADKVASSTFFTMGGTGAANRLEDEANEGGPGYAGAWSLGFGGGAATTLPGTESGSAGSTQVQLAAWYSGGGATSYAAAVASGLPAGASEVGILQGLGGANASGPPSVAPDLAGLGITSFAISYIPEPSTMVLGVIGALAFLTRRQWPNLKRSRA